jgi:hypothetical protein
MFVAIESVIQRSQNIIALCVIFGCQIYLNLFIAWIAVYAVLVDERIFFIVTIVVCVLPSTSSSRTSA